MHKSMQNNSNSQQAPWWSRDKKAGLQSRIKAIQRLNDPTTNADELLSGSKILLFLLLCFTGLLAGFSYYKNFSGAFPVAVAAFMAIALTVAIEWGKNYCTTWAIRTPFFRGFGHIVSTPANSFMFAGLILIAAATFTMSVINSTIGGRQLSVMLNHERNTTPFAANTANIDSLINTTQKNITEASTVKWKGVTTRTSQQAIKQYSTTLSSLNEQREAIIQQQRADWEKQQAVIAENRNYSANLMLTSGGWVELLQLLLILVRVACEKALDSRLAHNQEEQPTSGIGFQRRQQPAFGEGSTATPTIPEPRRPIGFLRDREPELPVMKTGQEQPSVPTTVPPENTVEQCATQEQPGTAPVPEQLASAETISLLADIKEWKKRCTQCFHRAINQQREEFREANRRRTACYADMLRAVGFRVTYNYESMYINIIEPANYTIGEEASREILKQKSELQNIAK